jgi:hypothetical protein
VADSGDRSQCTSQPQLSQVAQRMRDLTDEQRRALQLLARSPNGCTEALMMAHGFESEILGQLVLDGLAVAVDQSTMAGRRRVKVTWLRTTEAGRQAIAD